MSPATILAIINIVNGLITVAKAAPDVVDEAKSLVSKVEPHVVAAGDSVQQAFATVKSKLESM